MTDQSTAITQTPLKPSYEQLHEWLREARADITRLVRVIEDMECSLKKRDMAYHLEEHQPQVRDVCRRYAIHVPGYAGCTCRTCNPVVTSHD